MGASCVSVTDEAEGVAVDGALVGGVVVGGVVVGGVVVGIAGNSARRSPGNSGIRPLEGPNRNC